MNLREAATQAVQAYDAHDSLAMVMEELRAALVEPTVPSDCPDSHQPGCDRCRSPLWASTKCDVCGRKA